MVTDKQVRRLMMLIKREKIFRTAADKSGMDEKTARGYRDSGKLPSQCKKEHIWRTRIDSYKDVWKEIKENLVNNPGLEAKTLFDDLQRRYAGQFSDGQLRTLQRRIKGWRAMEGPAKEVFFPQTHKPGDLCESDFTHLTKLGITIQGQPFAHLIYHFVLTYSNWETGTICFSESFESLCTGLQNALWELGGVPRRHRTDQLTAAVQPLDHPEEFTKRYQTLLNHYNLEGCKIQAGKPNENGDIEQRNHRFKRALDQALMLRGSRDFDSEKEYEFFLGNLFDQLNRGRKNRFREELDLLHRLPERRLQDYKKIQIKVGPSSTVRILNNVYSVNSRLVGEWVDCRLYIDKIELWYAQKHIETLPRLRGKSKHCINYRHIIDQLIRKPGAFENYRYREDLFPSIYFRIAYDHLIKANHHPVREYLQILNLAAKENESLVSDVIRMLIEKNDSICIESIRDLVRSGQALPSIKDVTIDEVDLSQYDLFFEEAA